MESNKKEEKKYFGSKSWYEPCIDAADFSESYLNKIEKANVKLILKYENR